MMEFFSKLKTTTPSTEELAKAAAGDYREATNLLNEARAKLAEARAAVPAMGECMTVMRAAVESARKDLEELADARLKYFADPHFDPKLLGELDLTLNARSGSLANFAFALFPDAWLELAEQRLRKMGADKSKLTFAEKAKRIAALEADVTALDEAKTNALHTWRRLVNDKDGFPT